MRANDKSMKQKLINLVRNTYGSSTEIDNINENDFIGNIYATIELYCIYFAYEDVDGNKEVKELYFTPSCGWENLEVEFLRLINDYNIKNRHNQMRNVAILDSWLETKYSIIL